MHKCKKEVGDVKNAVSSAPSVDRACEAGDKEAGFGTEGIKESPIIRLLEEAVRMLKVRPRKPADGDDE